MNSHTHPIVIKLSISSLRKKFSSLSSQIRAHIDILLASEIKNDDYKPPDQFRLGSFGQSFRLDRSSNGVGVFIYAWSTLCFAIACVLVLVIVAIIVTVVFLRCLRLRDCKLVFVILKISKDAGSMQ